MSAPPVTVAAHRQGGAVTTHQPAVDLADATAAARDLLRALGVDTDQPGTARTPERMARACVELFAAPPVELTTFPDEEGYDELVLVTDVPFRSLCEHHLLPFAGVAHVGYPPGERIVGLSELARVVEHLAARPQVQERLTTQVATLLQDRLAPQGVGVVLEAEHQCMSLRGVRATGASTRTSALLGRVRTDARTRAEFLQLARGGAA